MRSLQNANNPNLKVFSFLTVVLALAIALTTSPLWLGAGAKTHAAPTQSVTQQGTPPAPALPPVVSQGVSVHGVPAWEYDGYRGGTIKIGIIDWDFQGFTNLMGTELPPNTPILTRVHAQCYTAMSVHTDMIADCEDPCAVNCPDYVGHGTSVAEIIADVAPSASLYIANPSKFDNSDLQATVEWMAGQGVNVINHSIGYGINAPGDGSSGTAVSQNHILDIIDYAVTNGITWVNSGGNNALKTWYGPYTEG